MPDRRVKLILLQRVVYLIYLCLLSITPVGVSAAGQPPSVIESCAYCHGDDGNTSSLDVPRLAGQPAGYLARQLRAFRDGYREGGAKMGAVVQRLSDRDIDAIAAYFAAQPVQLTNRPIKNPNTQGAQLYNRGKHGMPACIACHVPLSRQVSFDYPRVLGQNGFYLRQQLHAFRNGTRRTDPMAVMRTIMQQLSNTEIDAVSHYAAKSRP